MNSEKEIEEKWKALTKMSATFMFIQEVISTEQFDEKLLLKILAINLADKLKEISKEVKELRAIAPRLFQDSRGKKRRYDAPNSLLIPTILDKPFED